MASGLEIRCSTRIIGSRHYWRAGSLLAAGLVSHEDVCVERTPWLSAHFLSVREGLDVVERQ